MRKAGLWQQEDVQLLGCVVLLRSTLVGDGTLSPLGISMDCASSATEGAVCLKACVPGQFPLLSQWPLGSVVRGKVWPEYKVALGKNDFRERKRV